MFDDPTRRAAASARRLAYAGPLAAFLFAASLLGFAAARDDGYTHATKAVSELGATGSAGAFAFNLLGFIIPGVLVVVLAFALATAAATGRWRAGPHLLASSGAALIVTGLFPVDMGARGSTFSTLHLVGAMLTGLFWSLGLFFLGPMLDRGFGLRSWGRLTPWFILFPLANIAWQVAWQAGGLVMPGWGQRIGFAGYFIWLAGTGLAVAARRHASEQH